MEDITVCAVSTTMTPDESSKEVFLMMFTWNRVDIIKIGTSLVAQWSRICLPVHEPQET